MTEQCAGAPHGGEPEHAIELLSFRVDPQHVEEFIAADHRIWTLGLAMSGDAPSPLIAKEVWLDDADPGTVHVVITWANRAVWKSIPQQRLDELEDQFTQTFAHPYRLTDEQSITGSKLRRHQRWCPQEV